MPNLGELNLEALKGVDEKDASKLIRSAFNQINAALVCADDGILKFYGFGRLKIRTRRNSFGKIKNKSKRIIFFQSDKSDGSQPVENL